VAKEPKRRGRPRTGRIAVNITLPETIRDQLEQVAEEEQAPMSEIIERLLRRYFSIRRKGKQGAFSFSISDEEYKEINEELELARLTEEEH
jgi:hypothetical protein